MKVFNERLGNFFQPVNKKSIVLIICPTLVFIFLLWIWGISSSISERESIIKIENDHLSRMSETVAAQTENFFDIIRVSLATFNEWIKNNPDRDPRFDPEFIDMINAFRTQTYKELDIRLVTNSAGVFYLPSKSTTPLRQVADRDYFIAQQNKETRGYYIGKSIISRVTGKWGIPISMPTPPNKAGISVIFANIELSLLNRMYEKFRPSNNGSIMLLRRDGMVMTRVPFIESLVGTSIAKSNLWNESRTENNRFKRGYIVSETDGARRLISVRRLDHTLLTIAVTSDYDYLLRPWKIRTAIRLIFVFTMTLVIVLLFYFLVQETKRNKVYMHELAGQSITLSAKMDQINRELQEKQIIVAEANHRIKNHIAQLASIIRLSKTNNTDNIHDLLSSKIAGFKVLYEKLTYSDNSNDTIDLSAYIPEVMEQVIEIYRENKPIEHSVYCDSINVTSKKGSAIGVIITELTTNTIKHTCSSDTGTIRIKVTAAQCGGSVLIDYSDNGKQFDFESKVSQPQAKSIGFILINTLIRQYDGSIAYNYEDGSHIHITL